ncbi:MAG TPA: ATP-binding cassette domain-containing protein [Acidimicrobiales bacterium]|nr:ATP-binding cassette domain-containing protein [Acidimicrobiales bacterium]
MAGGHAGSDRADASVGRGEELRANLRGLGLTWKASPVLAFSLLALTLAQGVAPALVVAQTGRFLRALPAAVEAGAASAPGREVRSALVLIAGAVFVTQVLGPLSQAVLFGLQRRFEGYLGRRLMAATIALPGLAWFEDPGFRDQLQVSHWIGFGPVHTLQSVAQVFQQLAQVTAMAAVAATFAGWVPAVVIVACLPAAAATWRFQAVVGLARWRGSTDARRADYYRDLAVLRDPGKELRVFGLGGWATDRQRAHWLASVRGLWASRRRMMLVLLGLQLVALSALSLCFVAMLDAAVDGRTDVGTFTAAVTATISLLASVVGVSKTAGDARRNSFYLPSAVRILDLAETEPRLEVRRAGGAARPADPGPAPAERGIRFEGVTFAYPGTDRKVVDGLDLWVPAGSSLALVGENGAGKTTLVKLLARFYDPDEGRITLDGVDLRDLDLDALRARMAVIFQDFVRYQLPARDNVGFGAVASAGDQALLDSAAAAVGVLERIRSLPDGWDTVLAREFGGVDLSGGEWQRIALARAVMAQLGPGLRGPNAVTGLRGPNAVTGLRGPNAVTGLRGPNAVTGLRGPNAVTGLRGPNATAGADLLVLDEPTASLDVRVEHELYEQFADLSQGRTTLLVSHRFSTVRMAGRIVLLAGGRVAEDGAHDQLLAAGGRYAALYELQASHYRLTGRLE